MKFETRPRYSALYVYIIQTIINSSPRGKRIDRRKSLSLTSIKTKKKKKKREETYGRQVPYLKVFAWVLLHFFFYFPKCALYKWSVIDFSSLSNKIRIRKNSAVWNTIHDYSNLWILILTLKNSIRCEDYVHWCKLKFVVLNIVHKYM